MLNIKSFPEGKGTTTPWGPAQTRYKLCRGVNFYSCAGHGGIAVAPGWAKEHLSEAARLSATWIGRDGRLFYEEDCDCMIVFYEHPELWEGMTDAEVDLPQRFREARDSVRRWCHDYCRRINLSIIERPPIKSLRAI